MSFKYVEDARWLRYNATNRRFVFRVRRRVRKPLPEQFRTYLGSLQVLNYSGDVLVDRHCPPLPPSCVQYKPRVQHRPRPRPRTSLVERGFQSTPLKEKEKQYKYFRCPKCYPLIQNRGFVGSSSLEVSSEESEFPRLPPQFNQVSRESEARAVSVLLLCLEYRTGSIGETESDRWQNFFVHQLGYSRKDIAVINQHVYTKCEQSARENILGQIRHHCGRAADKLVLVCSCQSIVTDVLLESRHPESCTRSAIVLPPSTFTGAQSVKQHDRSAYIHPGEFFHAVTVPESTEVHFVLDFSNADLFLRELHGYFVYGPATRQTMNTRLQSTQYFSSNRGQKNFAVVPIHGKEISLRSCCPSAPLGHVSTRLTHPASAFEMQCLWGSLHPAGYTLGNRLLVPQQYNTKVVPEQLPFNLMTSSSTITGCSWLHGGAAFETKKESLSLLLDCWRTLARGLEVIFTTPQQVNANVGPKDWVNLINSFVTTLSRKSKIPPKSDLADQLLVAICEPLHEDFMNGLINRSELSSICSYGCPSDTIIQPRVGGVDLTDEAQDRILANVRKDPEYWTSNHRMWSHILKVKQLMKLISMEVNQEEEGVICVNNPPLGQADPLSATILSVTPIRAHHSPKICRYELYLQVRAKTISESAILLHDSLLCAWSDNSIEITPVKLPPLGEDVVVRLVEKMILIESVPDWFPSPLRGRSYVEYGLMNDRSSSRLPIMAHPQFRNDKALRPRHVVDHREFNLKVPLVDPSFSQRLEMNYFFVEIQLTREMVPSSQKYRCGPIDQTAFVVKEREELADEVTTPRAGVSQGSPYNCVEQNKADRDLSMTLDKAVDTVGDILDVLDEISPWPMSESQLNSTPEGATPKPVDEDRE